MIRAFGTVRAPDWWLRRPDQQERLLAALCLALLALLIFLANTTWGPHYVRGTAADLGGPLEGARRILAGVRDVYASPFAPYVTEYPLSYPLTTSFLVLPLAWFPPQVAAAIFVALSTGIAAYMIGARRRADLLLFASAPAVLAWCWAQWSPLLLIQGVAAWTVLLGAAKPQMGLVMFALRPSWRGAVLALLAAAATLLWWPSWPLDWLAGSLGDVTEVAEHRGALFAPLGVLLLAAAVRWRDPRARMFLALAIIPNRLAFYDQLCLGLVADSPRRLIIWVACTWLGLAAWGVARLMTGGEALVVRDAAVIVTVYGPALYFLLRNSGDQTRSVSTSQAQ